LGVLVSVTTQPREGSACDRLSVGVMVNVAADGFEGLPDRAFLEAEILQGRESVGPRHRRLGHRLGAVGGAVTMIEAEAGDGVAFDDETTLVLGSMVGATQRDEAPRIVRAALFSAIEMVNLDERRVGAPGHGTTAAVAA
jgi:hypothetical protein